MFVCPRMFCFVLVWGLISRIWLEKGLTYNIISKEIWNICICLWQSFDHHSVQLCTVLDGICALGKAPVHSTMSLRGFPNAAFEMAPAFVWFMVSLSRPFKEDHWVLASFHTSLLLMCWCPWLCARGLCLSSSILQIFWLSWGDPVWSTGR